jgi:hypothetical protein
MHVLKQACEITAPIGEPHMRIGAADQSSPYRNTGMGMRLAILRSTGSRAAGKSRRPSPRLNNSEDGACVCDAYIEAACG